MRNGERLRLSSVMVLPLTLQKWEKLTFIHWRYPAELLAARLPRGLELDVCAGSGWVSMTPFLLSIRPPGLPGLSRVPETNLRTYVRGPGGSPGIWFFSLDIGNAAAALGARLGYWLPYAWSEMRVREQGSAIRYASRRIVPPGAYTSVRVEVGRPLIAGELEDFLSARFRLFTRAGPLLLKCEVRHPPWPLCEARLLELDESLLQAAGLPQPAEEALVQFSPGVEVQAGPPTPVL
jgi:uncharacterized protein YqjF (DUF2071 family)